MQRIKGIVDISCLAVEKRTKDYLQKIGWSPLDI